MAYLLYCRGLLELELIQPHMTQKPVLRGEVDARLYCWGLTGFEPNNIGVFAFPDFVFCFSERGEGKKQNF